MFDRLPAYADDPILGLFETYKADPRPDKVNLGIGIYCDEAGQVPVLESVRAAREAGAGARGPSVYLPTEGGEAYRHAVRELVFGGNVGNVVVVQTVAGTGALKVGADFLKGVLPDAAIWMPDPTWANHAAIFAGAGFRVESYPYYAKSTGRFDLDGAVAALRKLQAGSVVLLHPCCHNPTGVDPSQAEWRGLLDVIEQRGLLPFFDMAYQGFAHGVDEDAWAVRECVRRGIACLVASSFSKIFSLYGERVGALAVHAPSADQGRLLGQLKLAIRRSYSCPPAQGAALVEAVLSNAAWNAQWRAELDAMRERMRAMRTGLHRMLGEALPGQDFGFLVEQNGMFSYSGLSAGQIAALQSRHGVYVVGSGRICVAGLNGSNIARVCEALADVCGGEVAR
ncbi:UNVERIFIED_ORG: aromatic-amino-acid transaminase [Variovorax guangxiensis]